MPRPRAWLSPTLLSWRSPQPWSLPLWLWWWPQRRLDGRSSFGCSAADEARCGDESDGSCGDSGMFVAW